MHVIRKVKTPGNRMVRHLERGKVGKRLCANCKSELGGVPALIPSRLNTLSKTKKIVTRAYGSYLCGDCTKEKMNEKAFNL